MKTRLLRLIAAFAAPITLAGTALADNEQYSYAPGQDDGPPLLILYSGENFSGEAREIYDPVYALPDMAFNDRARSVAVLSGQWEVCEHSDFTGRCVFLRYDVPDLAWFGLSREVSSVRPVYEYTEAEHGLMFERDDYGYIRYVDNESYGYDTYSYGYGVSTAIQVTHYGYSPDYRRYGYYDPRLGYDPYGFGWNSYGYYDGGYYRPDPPPLRGHYGARDAAVTLYVDANERGPSFGINREIRDLSQYRFNDNVSSIQIRSGKWEVCEHANFTGRCQIVDASVDKLNGLRLNDNISSIRPVGGTGRDSWDRHERGGRDGGWDGRRDAPRDGRPGDGRSRDGRPPALAGAQPVAPAAVEAPAPQVTTPPGMRRTGERSMDRRRVPELAGGEPGTPALAGRPDRGGRDGSGRTRPATPVVTSEPAAAPRGAPRTLTPQASRVGTPPERDTRPPGMRRIEPDRRDVGQPAAAPSRRVMPATPPARVERPVAPEPRTFTPPSTPAPRAVTPPAPARSFTPPPAPAPRVQAPPPQPKAQPQRDTRPPALRSRDRPTRDQD
ncbi:MAG: beta/gamma crystallin-related protein [Hyphomonas sp.]